MIKDKDKVGRVITALNVLCQEHQMENKPDAGDVAEIIFRNRKLFTKAINGKLVLDEATGKLIDTSYKRKRS